MPRLTSRQYCSVRHLKCLKENILKLGIRTLFYGRLSTAGWLAIATWLQPEHLNYVPFNRGRSIIRLPSGATFLRVLMFAIFPAICKISSGKKKK